MIRLLLWVWTALLSASAVAGSDSAEALRIRLESIEADGPAQLDGQQMHQPSLVARFYEDRAHKPLWTGGGELADHFDDLLAAIDDAALHGLDPDVYHVPALASLRDPISVELLATDAFLTHADHRATGAVSPRSLDPDWHLIMPEIDSRHLLEIAARSGDGIQALLDGLWPDSEEYRQLVAERARLVALSGTRPPPMPAGPSIHPGDRDERVPTLKTRLFGPDEHTTYFDAGTVDAVRRFQRRAGLAADGVVGAATVEALNAPPTAWVDRIDANLERWRWLPARVPDTYVRVNIAAFSLRVVQAGEDALRMDVIVGRPYRRTPVFAESIRYLVFNPFWNVPRKIAVQDKLPELKADAATLASEGFEVRLPGSEAYVPVDQVAWRDMEPGTFRDVLRQRPGPMNAMGRVKFMLPNPYSVYLHDTPNRDLFALKERSFSSGCIRLAQPLELADWVLRHDGQADAADRIPALLDSGETTTVHLSEPLPTYVVYFTAFIDAHDRITFRRDLYDRDRAIVTALRSGPVADDTLAE